MSTPEERALVTAIALFVRHCPIRDGAEPGAVLAEAEAVWRAAAASGESPVATDAISLAHEVAWLVLEDASLAPDEAHDDEERVLVDRLRLFMTLVPDRGQWIDYLATRPDAPRLAPWRARRAARARLVHGAVHPDRATLAAPAPEHARFVRGHVAGPVVCFACLGRHAPEVRLAAAGGEALLDARATLERRGEPPVEVALSVRDDAGWLRARLDPLDGGPPARGRWSLSLHADDLVVEAELDLPTGWLGYNLGRIPPGMRPVFHRIELVALDGPA